MKNAFTLVELLLIVAIMAILGGMAAPFFSNSIMRNNLRETEDSLVSYLRKAQNYSQNGKDNVNWGVCLTANKEELVLFKETCLANNFVDRYLMPAGISLGDFQEVTFNATGNPHTAINFLLTSAIAARTIVINQNGAISVSD